MRLPVVTASLFISGTLLSLSGGSVQPHTASQPHKSSFTLESLGLKTVELQALQPATMPAQEELAEEAPSEAEAPVSAPAPVVVEVVKGDSLSKIAKAHNVTVQRLFDANSFIANPNIINPGDKIRIPETSESLATRPMPVAAPKSVQKPAPKAPVKKRVVNTAPAPAIADGSVWDRLARCESGGNWAINTGNGYYGGLQFNAGTWLSNGGGQYAPYAHLATREQQIDIAQHLHAARGFSPWPACSRKLGLL